MRYCLALTCYYLGDLVSKTFGSRINNFDPFNDEWYPIGTLNWRVYQWCMRVSEELDDNNKIWGESV